MPSDNINRKNKLHIISTHQPVLNVYSLDQDYKLPPSLFTYHTRGMDKSVHDSCSSVKEWGVVLWKVVSPGILLNGLSHDQAFHHSDAVSFQAKAVKMNSNLGKPYTIAHVLSIDQTIHVHTSALERTCAMLLVPCIMLSIENLHGITFLFA